MKLGEKEIRTKVIERLSTYTNCKIEEEYTTPSGKARADVLAINGHINAYEIKSDYDSLIRLPSQIREYDESFERNHIVTSNKYIEKCYSILPSHWGIILVEKNRLDNLHLRFIKKATLNPNIEFINIVQHLSSSDLKKYINENNLNLKLLLSKKEVRNTFKFPLIRLCNDHLSKKEKQLFIVRVRETLKKGL